MPKREPWQVAGNAAEVYERELVPAVFGPWGPRVVELAALRRGLRVLDVACGTGLVARLAAEAVGVDGRVTVAADEHRRRGEADVPAFGAYRTIAKTSALEQPRIADRPLSS
jgi:predicted methyltransferase